MFSVLSLLSEMWLSGQDIRMLKGQLLSFGCLAYFLMSNSISNLVT
jgi:hypothetical protein